MQRDVKVGLVLGIMLVAIIAVVFFRKDESDREKFSQLLPSPEDVVDRARDALEPMPNEPYRVPPEHLADRWQGSLTRKKEAPSSSPRKSGPAVDAETDSVAALTPLPVQSASVPPIDPATIEPISRTKSRASNPPIRTANTDASIRSGSVALEPREYTIQEGDTLRGIASRLLGSSSQYVRLYDENRDVLTDPDHVIAGQTIRIPSPPIGKSATPLPAVANSAPLQPRKPNNQPRLQPTADSRVYEVTDGDTLTGIARTQLGKASLYLELLHANRDQLTSPEDLRPGMILRLP